VGYQHWIGRVDGRSCPSYPVCSAYAREAIRRYGLLWGSLLMLDRLIHEAGDLRRGPRIVVNGEVRLHDPLARNAFWLEAR
ncbi:MAG: membrane protein insertion efficiency factor YidD, partial [Zetaproteobacteria bacterium]